MRIYIEGLACAGKTTFIEYLQDKMPDTVCWIPELPADLKEINNEICRKNDIAKLQTALELEKDKEIVIVDRSYVSTLAYNFILYQLKQENEYVKTFSWYKENSFSGRLHQPDLFVYIVIDEKASIDRARTSGKFSEEFAWFLGPEYGSEYFNMFFKYIEPDVPILVLDGKNTFQENQKILLDFLAQKMDSLYSEGQRTQK